MSGQIQTLATPPPVSVQTLLYNIYLAAASGGSGGASWGSITGTLSAQTDLQTALDAKLPLTGGTLTPAANTTALTLGGSLTGSNAQATLSLNPTWNTTGAPALIYGRVTNTASNGSSMLIDLGTVAGGSMFSVRKDGYVSCALGIGTNIWYNAGGGLVASVNGSTVNFSGKIEFAAGAASLNQGTSSPEASVTANPGSVYCRNNSGTGELWLKTSGTGNTGWTKML